MSTRFVHDTNLQELSECSSLFGLAVAASNKEERECDGE
jgi:hypothetical protein